MKENCFYERINVICSRYIVSSKNKEAVPFPVAKQYWSNIIYIGAIYCPTLNVYILPILPQYFSTVILQKYINLSFV